MLILLMWLKLRHVGQLQIVEVDQVRTEKNVYRRTMRQNVHANDSA